MKRLLALTSVLLVSGVGIAAAAAPGVNLNYANCTINGAGSDRTFACNDNGSTFSLVASGLLGFTIPDFVATSSAVDVTLGSPSIPAWYQFGPGGCREGSLGLGTVGALAGCVNPYTGSNQAGGFVIEPGSAPNRFRVRLDWVRDTPAPFQANTLNSLFVLQMTTASSFDEGFGMCAGCNVPACFVLNAAELFSLSEGRVAIIEQGDLRNWATWQGGTGDCPGATASRSATWGAVKALYR
jgi:hypothetical protein